MKSESSITVNLTDREKELFEKAAFEQNISISQLVRFSVFMELINNGDIDAFNYVVDTIERMKKVRALFMTARGVN